MSIRTWFRTSRVRRGIAASAVVLSAGGLVLARAPAGAEPSPFSVITHVTPSGSNSVSFKGTGAHGTFSLSHTKVLAGTTQRVFAELTLKADETPQQHLERAPLSIVVVLDTSGSMAGEKIERAKESAIALVRDLRDDDEVAFVRYASESEIVQPLARADRVRRSLIDKIQALTAGGGTSIAPALSKGILALADAEKGRVRRVILASDGLDSTRAQSEMVARESAGRGITTSSMGIGLDFDESYMGGVAQAGHGNFAFVKDASTLAPFLQRELKETASTTIESARARITLPAGVRFVQAAGADAKTLGQSDELELSMGSLFSGDERRVIIELTADLGVDVSRAVEAELTWSGVHGDTAQARIAGLALTGSSDAAAVEASRDPVVFASAMSVIASRRQIEAAQAYQRGDVQRAQRLIDENVLELKAAATAAPAAAAAPLLQQMSEYETTKKTLAAAPPKSAMGNAAAKAATAKDIGNLGRRSY